MDWESPSRRWRGNTLSHDECEEELVHTGCQDQPDKVAEYDAVPPVLVAGTLATAQPLLLVTRRRCSATHTGGSAVPGRPPPAATTPSPVAPPLVVAPAGFRLPTPAEVTMCATHWGRTA